MLILSVLPWAGIIVFLLLIVKHARRLRSITGFDRERAPEVSVIIPARLHTEDVVWKGRRYSVSK